jgi:L-rhamnose isomerase / sugar isomerase
MHTPILAMARLNTGGVIDPIAAYRASGHWKKLACVRLPVTAGGHGIV